MSNGTNAETPSASPAENANTLTATHTVLVSTTDHAALTDWASETNTPLTVIAVDDWAEVPFRDLPSGPTHVIAETRESKDVWDTVRALCTALRQMNRPPLLTEITVPLSLILDPQTTWDSLTGDATSKPAGRAPAVEKERAVQSEASEPRCIPAMGRTVVEHEYEGKNGEPVVKQFTVLPWAAWEVTTEQDPYTTMTTLEVAYQTESGAVKHIRMPALEGLALDEFKWMETHPVVRKLPRPKANQRVEIANAIRAAEGPNGEVSFSRTGELEMGWIEVDGCAFSTKTDAGLGADGIEPTVFGGDVKGSAAYFWGEEVPADAERRALRAVTIDMPAQMNVADTWLMLLAQHGAAVSPVAARAPIVLTGLTNNGKTAIARCAAGLGSKGLLKGKLANFNATRTAVEMIAGQFTTGICLIDDIPPVTDPAEVKRIRESLDELFRVAHPEGTLKARGTIRKGGVALAEQPEVHPCVLVTTEENPLTIMPRASTRNRGVIIEVVRGREFDSAAASHRFEAIAAEHGPAAGYAITRAVAADINRAGGLTAYEAEAEKVLKALTIKIGVEHPEWIDRCRWVYGSLLIGLTRVANIALAADAISADEHAAFLKDGSHAITRTYEVFVKRYLSDAEGAQVLADLFVQVRAGRVFLAEQCSHGVKTSFRCSDCGMVRTVGRRVLVEKDDQYAKGTKQGELYMALLPTDLADVLSAVDRPRSADHVAKQLTDIEGSFKARLRINGQRNPVVIVPIKAFGFSDDDVIAMQEREEKSIEQFKTETEKKAAAAAKKAAAAAAEKKVA